MKVNDAIKYYGSQRKLCEALNITDSAISRWKERGQNVPIKSAVKLNQLTDGAIDLRLRDY